MRLKVADFFPEPAELEARHARHRTFFGPAFKGEGAYFLIQAPNQVALAGLAPLKRPADLRRRWFDVEYRTEELLRQSAGLHWAGDAIPAVFVNFSCRTLAGLLGAPYRLDEETIWFDVEPLAAELDQLPKLTLKRDGELNQAIRETTAALAELAGGRYVVGLTDIGANTDVLMSLVAHEPLLKSFFKQAPRLDEALADVNRAWLEFFDDNYRWITAGQPAVSSFNCRVYPGRWCKLMSETSVMLSPKHFERYILPCLQWQIDRLDRAIFNLDGLGQAHLLPSILKLQGLDHIEWHPVPQLDPDRGIFVKDYLSPRSLEIMNVIQKAGKKLGLSGVAPFQLDPLMAKLAPDGLWLSIYASSPDEAEEIARYVRRWRRS
ncbi:MAG: hypothetical protein LBU12_07680 [Deltaproteobacteria bacterium]|jgi:hypothetical protein|nr:hypothetical protein [Deltaproteobacteria bacterium]